ncbi:MAG: trimeric intracellular cation channel family protein [Pseudomonadota bacterium]
MLLYVGDVVFAVTGALVALRLRMDVVGFVLMGVLTGIGGGTMRDLLLARPVWWVDAPLELLLCAGTALAVFALAHLRPPGRALQRRTLVWADALGLATFAVVGCHIALDHGAPFVVAVAMGMITATGGGVLRDVVANRQPLITQGQLYATAALVGASTYALLDPLALPGPLREALAFWAGFLLRAVAIRFDVRLGPPGRALRIGAEPRRPTGPGDGD